MSVRQSLGKVAVVPKGSWDGTNTYEFLDIVKSGGGSYIARQDVPIGIAITNTEYWVSLVDKGEGGDDGVSPTVQTEAITGGHRVTITDAEHPSGQTFDVMDGAVDSVNGKTGVVVLDASDVGALPDSTVIPPTVTEQTVSGWGFTKNAVRYDEQMALTDTQKATARSNIGAVGQLEYDALESDVESLEIDLSLKLDAADAPTKVSDLQNDTGFVTASQVPAAPVQSVNGRTGAVTVNEVPDASGASVGQVLSKTASGIGWTTPSGGGGGAASLIINLYYHSATDSYTTSASPTQLYNSLPNCALAAAEHTIPVTAYKKGGTNYVTAVFVDQSFANGDTSALVWTLTAATSSSTVTVTREEVAVDGVPDSTSATVGQVLTKTANGLGWAAVDAAGVKSDDALQLEYDSVTGDLSASIGGLNSASAITAALRSFRIGTATFKDLADGKVYGLYSVGNAVTFARAEPDCIRMVSVGAAGDAPDYFTRPLAQTPRAAMTAQDTAPTLEANRLYVFPEMASLAITLGTIADNSIINEYHFIFTSGATATTLTIPASVRQPDGFTVDANHVYEVSILENCMTAQGWAVSAE